MEKTIYEVPSTRILEIRVLGVLASSVESMKTVAGSWDDEEDW